MSTLPGSKPIPLFLEMLSMDVYINSQILQNPWITPVTDIRVYMDRVQTSYLSDGVDTDITLSASMDIHSHPLPNRRNNVQLQTLMITRIIRLKEIE